MGKLFLPKETHGIWDAKNNGLTIYVGETAYVGYAGTKQELEEIEFSAFANGIGECAWEVYDEGPGRLSTLIQTERPCTLQFTVTNGGKQLAKPITIYVRMRPDYRHMQPEGQLDETACWAACLAFWLRAAGRTPVSQLNLLKYGSGMWSHDGTILPTKLEQLVTKQGYKMKFATVKPNNLRDYLGFWPLMLGFTASGGFGHMNVLVGHSDTYDTVDAMEPMYPDPIFDDGYEPQEGENGLFAYLDKTTRMPFRYKGAVRTGLGFYSYLNSPMKAGTFWVGYPSEYVMP